MNYALIMAGGTGTRMWPLSRFSHPKQLLKLVGDESMFEHATNRLAPLFAPEQIYVIARDALNRLLSASVPAVPTRNFITEPEGRGTAPAIGLAALHLQRRDPGGLMAVLTADHYIADRSTFRGALSGAIQLARDGHLVTLGIRPSSPSTGYGYIKHGIPLKAVEGFEVFHVERFTEKPDLEAAIQMVASSEYSWNSGMFIWRVDRILQEFERQMPSFYAQLMDIDAALGTPDYASALAHIWPSVKKQSIDYGIMEDAENVVVMPADIGWSDVGSWSSLFDVLPTTDDGNVVVGDHVGIDTRGTLVMGGRRLIATIGLENLVIVDADDALLVCTRDREQDVRDIVKRLRDAGRTDLI